MSVVIFAIIIVWFLIFQDKIEKFLGFYKKNSNIFLIISFLVFLIFGAFVYFSAPKIYVLIYEIIILVLITIQIFVIKNYISNIGIFEKPNISETIVGLISILIFLVTNFGFLYFVLILKNFRKILGF